MQRVISLQTFRSADRSPGSEFVTKRLCCSFLFSVAFLSLLGGFLLGRYASDRAMLLKSQFRQYSEECRSSSNISLTVQKMLNLSRAVAVPSHREAELQLKFKCLGYDLQGTQTKDFGVNFECEKMYALGKCFGDVVGFLEALNSTA